MAENAFYFYVFQSIHFRDFFGKTFRRRLTQPMKTGVDFDVNFGFFLQFSGDFIQLFRLRQGEYSLGDILLCGKVKKAVRRMTEDKEGIIRIGLSQFQSFCQRSYSQIGGSAFHQYRRDADAAVTVSVGFDHCHDGHIRAG